MALAKAAGGALALGLALLVGCSGSAASDGPFGNGGGSGGSCVPVPHGGVITYAFEEFRNSGGTGKIEMVSLEDPHSLRILAAWAVPVTGHVLYGVQDGWPSAQRMPPGELWASRQRANGAVIPHTTGSEVINLVLVLKPGGNKGTASALDVSYRVGSAQYQMRMPFSIEAIVAKRCTSA